MSERKLKEFAQDERDRFESDYEEIGCSCHINPPCSRCTHPGNPINQIEHDENYELENE